MMKFNLVVNSQEQDGFHLSTQSESQEELAVVKELTTLLISKIEKISVNVTNYTE